ncbi:hypothetical protein CBS9595_001169 [Malassezia furfur]|nr:hypothetical protein CBS9595_001169 [Malassezia furfur]
MRPLVVVAAVVLAAGVLAGDSSSATEHAHGLLRTHEVLSTKSTDLARDSDESIASNRSSSAVTASRRTASRTRTSSPTRSSHAGADDADETDTFEETTSQSKTHRRQKHVTRSSWSQAEATAESASVTETSWRRDPGSTGQATWYSSAETAHSKPSHGPSKKYSESFVSWAETSAANVEESSSHSASTYRARPTHAASDTPEPSSDSEEAEPMSDDGPSASASDDGPTASTSDDGPTSSATDDGPSDTPTDNNPKASASDDSVHSGDADNRHAHHTLHKTGSTSEATTSRRHRHAKATSDTDEPTSSSVPSHRRTSGTRPVQTRSSHTHRPSATAEATSSRHTSTRHRSRSSTNTYQRTSSGSHDETPAHARNGTAYLSSRTRHASLPHGSATRRPALSITPSVVSGITINVPSSSQTPHTRSRSREIWTAAASAWSYGRNSTSAHRVPYWSTSRPAMSSAYRTTATHARSGATPSESRGASTPPISSRITPALPNSSRASAQTPDRSRPFVNTESLVLPKNQAQPPMRSSTASLGTAMTPSPSSPTSAASSSTSHGHASSSVPAYPAAVVPLGASNTAPKDTTSVAVLFKRTMPWLWVVEQRETAAQIFTYMPRLLATGTGSDPQAVTTKELRAYTLNDTVLTLYLAYVPVDKVQELQAALQDPTAAMTPPHATPVEVQLLSQIDPSFDILAYSPTDSDDASNTIPLNTRTALVSSFSGIAGLALLGFVVWLVRRCNHRRMEKQRLKRRNTIQSFSALSNSPVSIPCDLPPAPRASSFYVGDPHGSSVTAFESDGVTGTLDVASASLLGSCPVAPDMRWNEHVPTLSHTDSESSATGVVDPYCYSDLIPNVRPSSSMHGGSLHRRSHSKEGVAYST